MKAKKSPSKKSKTVKAVRSPMPTDIIPMAMVSTHEAFNHKDWLFELKWDGFRALAYCAGEEVKLRSKNNQSFNTKFASIKGELVNLRLNAVLDGEITVLNETGVADFNKIMYSINSGTLVYYVFDILWYNGYSLINVPLVERKKILKSILQSSNIVRFSDHVTHKGKEFYKLAQQHRIEGIVAKYKHGLYYPGGRTTGWIKIKTAQVVQGVIAGFILDQDKPGTGFNSLIIAQKKEKGYKYIGQVGVGISKSTLNKVLQAKRSKSIFSPVPNVNAKTAFRTPINKPKVVWIKPDLKCEIRCLVDHFGVMRHPSFKGLLKG